MGTCLGCGAALVRQQKVYCGVPCQWAHRQKQLTAQWLHTGCAPSLSSRANHYVRQYLRQAQDRRCAVCGSGDSWQGQPLAFVLDHIDGDASNNRRENLRLVCPNCDSQLPTFKSRNRGNGRAWRQRRYAEGKSY